VSTPLVDPDGDDDFDAWGAPDQSVFIAMAEAEVRKYCGWHIAPSLTVTAQRCWFGSRDLVMLPSAYVTAVDTVAIDGKIQTADTDYYWDAPNPWIRRKPMSWPKNKFALIGFTHGYDVTPIDVKAVIFELVSTAMELPASNATEIRTAQYNLKLRREIGMELTGAHRNRLGRYRIPRFGAQLC